MAGYPTFDEAEQELRTFLERQGHPGPLVWIFREDVLWEWRRLFVRLPLPEDQRALTRQSYEQAVGRGFGVKLQALARMGATSVCYLWAPDDEQDAMNTMTPRDHLKVYLHDPLIQGVGVTRRWRWALLRLRSRLRREWPPTEMLPLRPGPPPAS